MTSVDTEHTSAEPNPISGFWRRLFAFILDSLVIGAVGAGLGFFLYDSLAAIGGWGRIIGFAITLAYFSVMNSRIFRGQTLGKMVMKIRVASADGAPLTLPASILRSAIFCVPYFLNGAPFEPALRHSWLPVILSILVFGVGGSIAYLLVFNRRTRQSLHDLIVSSYVLRATTDAVPDTSSAPWGGHFAVVAGLVVVAAAASLFTRRLAEKEPFVSLLHLQTALAAERGVRYATVLVGSRFAASAQKGSRTSTFLSVQIVTDSKDIDQERLASRVAEIAFDTYAEAGKKDTVVVALTYGYDIGIASAWKARNFPFSPAQWRERITLKSNLSLNTETQLQAAASPRGLRSGQLRR